MGRTMDAGVVRGRSGGVRRGSRADGRGQPGHAPELERIAMQVEAARPRRPLLVMIVGVGAADADRAVLREAAVRLFEGGHVPMVGMELALPPAWSGGQPDPVFDGITDALAKRLLVRCDAMLRVGGVSPAADQMVRLAAWEGKPVYYRVADVPAVSP